MLAINTLNIIIKIIIVPNLLTLMKARHVQT